MDTPTLSEEVSNDQLEWVRSPASIAELAEQAVRAGRQWSFGWLHLGSDTRLRDVESALAELGAEVVGSTGRLVRARLPGDENLLRRIAMLPGLDGIGAMPPRRKLAPALADGISTRPAQERVAVFVTLMDEDPEQRWRRALEALGARAGRYDEAIRAYTASVSYGSLEAIIAADFVLDVEPIGIVRAAHETSVPAMGVDALRRYEVAEGLFSGVGGASVPVGVMDTGLNVNHVDIESHRRSICGANFVTYFDPLLEADDLWIDRAGHGTHVTGTLVGNGAAEPRLAGMAPLVRDIRFAKVLNTLGFGFGGTIQLGMDFLAESSACPPNESMAVKPLIVNMSLSSSSRRFEGRGTAERKLDSVVWAHRQLYVVAQSNEDIQGFSEYGTAKNALAVGATLDVGDLAPFSSHGPTADGRLAPQLVATGVRVNSTQGNASRSGYRSAEGTSMATPTVAGIAALLLDAAPEHREQPALARARLMASAIRPDAWLDDATAFPATNTEGPGTLQAEYGMGKASARTAILNREGANGWVGGGAVAALEDGEYSHVDIEVPEGAGRLDVVMTWDEPPADAPAQAVLNNLDLWADHGGDCDTAACGEYASLSDVDNVEWIIVRNPPAGQWRVKVTAPSVYTDAPRVGLAWTVVAGPSAPDLRVVADTEDLGADGTEVTATITTGGYVAAATRLLVDCRPIGESTDCDGVRIRSAAMAREDGLRVDVGKEGLIGASHGGWNSSNLGTSIPLGEVSAGASREIRLGISNSASKSVALVLTASAWNATSGSTIVQLGSSSAELPVWESPDNDAFGASAVLEGAEGSVSVDLLLATPEPGEPIVKPYYGRAAASVWYAWTAPADGSFRFEVEPEPESPAGYYDQVDVYTGDRITTLATVASGAWGALFFAREGQRYRVRLSANGRTRPVDLRWFPAPRPVNDDFADAVTLEGGEGSYRGSNAGATLETREWYGSIAATTWHRWTAPGDGWWRFSVPENVRVMVFEGDLVDTSRLISGLPHTWARFPAGEGREYRIAVGAYSTAGVTGVYDLNWFPIDKGSWSVSNDEVEDALSIAESVSGTRSISVGSASTVSPGEPIESGVRTSWWTWQAPESGFYTWRFVSPGSILLAVFDDSVTDEQTFVGRIPPFANPGELVIDAAADRQYWFSAGMENGGISGFSSRGSTRIVEWGLTPDNDVRSRAVALADGEGSVSGSNRFATVDRSEDFILGRGTLWWSYGPGESGWYRFSVDGDGGPWAVTVYHSDDAGELELVTSSRWRGAAGTAAEVLFDAEEGGRYLIALGVYDGGRGGDFTLSWTPVDPPAWLRYAGRVALAALHPTAREIQLDDLGPMAFYGPGLYVGSGSGLLVFERDPVTGDLTLHQVVPGDFRRKGMIWDPRRIRLLVEGESCRRWDQLLPFDGGLRLAVGDALVTVGGNCAQGGLRIRRLFFDSGASSLYRIGDGLVEIFAVDSAGVLSPVRDFYSYSQGLLSNDDRFVYAASTRTLATFERDAETGDLIEVDTQELGIPNLGALMASDDGAYLSVLDGRGEQIQILGLEDPAKPQPLANLSQFWPDPRRLRPAYGCRSVPGRSGTLAFDAFCDSIAFAVEWRPEDGALTGSDYAAPWQPDRYNNAVPEFGVPESVAASPDGRHVYAATRGHGILVFERVGAGTIDPAAVETTASAPLVPSASDANHEGFVRIINHSRRGGEVRITAVDDAGAEGDPAALRIGANRTVHLNSNVLESGEETRGFAPGVGSGDGDWRLALRSNLVVEALSYVRSEGGYVTPVHDYVPTVGDQHRVHIFNPADAANQISRLRLSNTGMDDASVSITGVDDAGQSPGDGVELTLATGSSRTLSASQLESGDGLEGALGNGTGKWRLTVASEQPIRVMNLMESTSGRLSNLSTVPKPDSDGAHLVPLVPASSNVGMQGVVRVINRTDGDVEVRITAFDDEGVEHGPVTLGLGSAAAVDLSSDELESGDEGKGLSGGIGVGQGDWRLELTADGDIDVVSYVRASDGLQSAMHDVVPAAGGRQRVATFNPGDNRNQASRLRLINRTDEAASVTISGIDGHGESPGTPVALTVPAGASRTVHSRDLESGAEGMAGSLGDGTGKWQLIVDSDQPIVVVNLLEYSTGHLANLSTIAPSNRMTKQPAD